MPTPRVLIVEDRFVVAYNLQDRLQTMGYSVLGIAPSGKEAIRSTMELQPDILLMDIRLQGDMDGIEAAREIRAGCDIPIVYLTGHADEPTLQRAKLTEPYGYLLKPFNARELHSTIEMALYRHAAERRVRESEAKYRALVEHSLQGILIARDVPPRLLFANRPCAEILGYSVDELLSLSPDEVIRLIHPADRAKTLERIGITLSSGSGSASDEVRFVRNDGSPRWLQYYASLIEHEGQPVFQAAIVDITERKEAEAALLEAHDELERRVEARTADLAQANLLLKQEVAQRQHAEETLRRRNRELALLNRIISTTATSRDVGTILQDVCRELAVALDLSQAAAVLTDEKTGQAIVVAEFPTGLVQPSLVGRTIAIKENPAFLQILQQERALVLDLSRDDPHLAPLRELVSCSSCISLLILPLFSEGALVGGLGLCAKGSRPLSVQEVDLAQRVAEQVSGLLARVRLAETQHRLGTAVEQTADAVLILDNNDSILYVNPAFERATGYSLAEALGQTPGLFRSNWHEEGFYQTLHETIAAGQVWKGRLINKRKDGTLFPTDATITPLRNLAGEVVNVVATLRDVTREAQLEEQIRHAQKMEAVGQLAGGIAHDFNNLLAVIQMSSALLQRQMQPEDPLLENVLQIQSTVTRAANITGQLLNFSRREVSRQQVVDLNQLIDDLDWMLRRLVGKDIKLFKSLAQDLRPVQATPSELEQVLVNLVVNARDAMPNGGTLTLETANTVLDEAYVAENLDARPGAHVQLTVSDTGVGIEHEVKPRIFEPFFTTKKRGAGTGLGLATVSGIVKQNGGHILVDSSLGQGATFQVFLPSGEGVAPQPEPKPDVVSDRATVGQTILVVEDEELVRNLTARMLRSRGYQVHVAGSGPEALRISEQCNGRVHLLLADLHMPEMSGLEVARELQSRWPQMQVLYMSGYSATGGLVRRVLDEGALFLPKPFDQHTLLEKVQAALDDA